MNSFLNQILLIIVCIVTVLIALIVYRLTLRMMRNDPALQDHDADNGRIKPMHSRSRRAAEPTDSKTGGAATGEKRPSDTDPAQSQRPMRSRAGGSTAEPEKEADHEEAERC